MRRIGFGLGAMIALIATAQAADIYTPAPGGYKDEPVLAYNWAGWYVGVNGGYGWSSDNKVTNYTVPATTTATATFTSEGGFGGGQLGYNFQRGSIVFGIEGDIQGSDISGGATASLSPTVWAHGTSSLDWFATIRGRLGVEVCERGLLYATGGVAFGGIHDKISKVDAGGPGSLSKSDTETGYVVGAGFEYALTHKWSAKAEYQHLGFGKDALAIDVNLPRQQTWGKLDADHSYDTVRLGLNYHFRPDYEPLK